MKFKKIKKKEIEPKKEIESKTFLRKFKGYHPIRYWNGLTIKQAFELELEVYNRLNGHKHFPKLLEINEKKYQLLLEHCGITLNNLPVFTIPNLNIQINSIHESLESNNIIHLDIRNENICFKNENIYLIDFDIVVLDRKPLSKILKKYLSHHRRGISAKKRLQNILKLYY